MIHNGGIGAKQGVLDKIVFKAKDKGLANFVIDGEFYSDKGQLIQTNFENLQLQIGKEENLEMQSEAEQGNNTQTNNALLQQFRVDIEGMVPSFQSNIYQYDLTIPGNINDIEVLAVPENPNSQVEVTGNTRFKCRPKFYKSQSNITRQNK